MRRLSPTLLALAIVLGLTVPATAQLTVGSVSTSRTGDWTLDGARMEETRAKLESAANFGPGGTVDTAIQIVDVTGALTPALLAGFDAFFVGYVSDGTLSGAELVALANWVEDGGTLVLTCDDPSHDAVCELFDAPVVANATPPTVPALLQIAHPLFTGPFGVAQSISNHGNYAIFDATGPELVLGRDTVGEPVILLKGHGDGVILILGDVDMISDDSLTPGAAIDPTDSNDVLLGNLFAALTGDGCRLDSLCLGDGRFELRTTWRTDSDRGLAMPTPLERDSGTFWFFNSANQEMLIKVLNGCAINQRFWVFAGGLTNVRVRMAVRDTLAEVTEVYVNPLGTPFVAIQDVDAFATCF